MTFSHVVDSIETEIKAILDPHDDLMIGQKLSKPSSKPPTSLRLLKQLPGNKYCHTVCSHRGVIYVGLGDGSINRIDATGKLTAAFIKLPKQILTIRAHQDRLIILLSQQSSIYVYSLEGQQVAFWDHSDTGGSYVGNKLCIISGQIYVGVLRAYTYIQLICMAYLKSISMGVRYNTKYNVCVFIYFTSGEQITELSDQGLVSI